MVTPGDRIGDWEVVLPLGQGGMGSVFRCRHALSHRIEAAVKVLNAHDVRGARERFIREAEALHALSHPAIVRVHGFGQDASTGLLWIAMELVEGQNFEHLLQDGAFPYGRAPAIFAPIAEGLAYAHSRGIVHRDLKPANLMLRADGRAVVLDFGIAVQEGHDRLTQEGVVPGTVAYAAPEQVTFGANHDPALADIYALGQVLCECLTGRFTFPRGEQTSDQRRAVRILKKKLRMGALDPGDDVPEHLRALVLSATQPDPSRRGPPFSAWPQVLSGRASQPTGDITSLIAAEPLAEPIDPAATLLSDDDIDLDASHVEQLPPDLALPDPDDGPAERESSIHDAETEVLGSGAGAGAVWLLVGVAAVVVLIGLVSLGVIAAAGGAAWWSLTPVATAPADVRPLRDVLHPEPPDTDPPVADASAQVPAPDLVTAPPPPSEPRPPRRPTVAPPPTDAASQAKLVIGADRSSVVTLNGARLRMTPVTRRLAPGTYEVRLDAGEGRTKTFTVELEPGETVRRIWDFGDGEWRSFDGGIDERNLPARPRLSGIELKIRAMPQVAACLRAAPQPWTVTLRFVVVPDGTIAADGVEPSEVAGTELERCLFRAVRTLQLEPSRAGAVVRVQVGG